MDALAEKTFVTSLYHEDPERRFSLESCVPSPEVLATALLVRWRSDPRWHTLMYEAIGLETAYGEEVSRGRLVAVRLAHQWPSVLTVARELPRLTLPRHAAHGDTWGGCPASVHAERRRIRARHCAGLDCCLRF